MVTPAYVSDLTTVYHGKAEDVLPTLGRESVALIATDPPYGAKFQSAWRIETYARIEGDDGSLDVEAILSMAFPALKRRRHLYVFGPADMTKLPVSSTATLIWDKEQLGMGDLSLPFGPGHETIQFGVARFAKSERDKGRGGLSARVRQGSVLRVRRSHGLATRHPTEKPVALMRQLIESSSVMGETVLDPFAGSGSTLVAAVLLGRRAVGIELDAGHVATTIERLKVAEALAGQMAAA